MSSKYPQLFLLIALLVSAVDTQAQFQEVIATGRPGQSIGALVVGGDVLQFQSGITLTDVSAGSLLQHTTVFRQGIDERFELSAVFGWSLAEQDNGPLSSSSSDIVSSVDVVHIGGRVHLLDNTGIVPSLALQARAILPTVSKSAGQRSGVRVLIPAVHSLADDWSLTTNLGADRLFPLNGQRSVMRYFYTLSLGYSISERVGSFVEVFGALDGFTADYDAGLSYLINNDLAIDLSGGLLDVAGSVDPFLDFGFSWRVGSRLR